MNTIPQNYADIEDSPPYREAQKIGLLVSQHTAPEEYWHFFDEQEMRLLRKAKPNNITFYLDNSLTGYRVHVGLEGYMREPESCIRTIWRMFQKLPPLPLRGTDGRPNEGKVKLRLPPDRQEQIVQQLSPEALKAVIQAAFARQCYALMRVHNNNEDVRMEVLEDLQKQYKKAMKKIIPR